MSSLPKEIPALERLAEAERHDLVAEDDRLLLAAVAIDHVDHLGDVTLGKQRVHEVEGHVRVLRRKFANKHASGRRVHDLRDQIAVGILRRVRALTLAWSVTDFDASACSISDMLPKTMPSPGSFSFWMVT